MTSVSSSLGRASAAAAAILVIGVSAADAQVASQADVEAAARTISQADFAWRVGVIAHDSMGGRDTPSPGLEMTANWAASEFRRMGLRGGMPDGSFVQRYPLNSLETRRRALLGHSRRSAAPFRRGRPAALRDP